MAYVVAEACIKCKYTDCVAVCPVDCFYEGENALVINPDECIHCGACEPECPTNAIYDEDDLPEKWKAYRDINALFSGAKTADQVDKAGMPKSVLKVVQDKSAQVWPNINAQKAALDGADDEAKREGKTEELSPNPGG
jgi:ferredoxin